MTVRVGRWFLHWNRYGTWGAEFNAQGHYRFRGRKVHLTRIREEA